MTRTHIVSLMALIVAIPAAAAGSYFSSTKSSGKSCFTAGGVGYEISTGADARFTVRIDNTAANPSLRMQIVDDPAAADFVLVDDGDSTGACQGTTAINNIRINPQAAHPDMTVSLSRTNADHKIYVRSVNYTDEDAAALFAVIWLKTAPNKVKTAAASR